MAVKKIYIFVEGNDDERFFGRIIKPLLLKIYDDVEIIQYAQMKKEKVDLFLLSIKTLSFDYIFTADKDEFNGLNEKKKYISARYNQLNSKQLAIVVTEIESWYYSGLTSKTAQKFLIEKLNDTEILTKEKFNLIYRGKFKSRIDFMMELLKNFSIKSAIEANRSFAYFNKKFVTIDNQ